jgi:Serine protease inhibitor
MKKTLFIITLLLNCLLLVSSCNKNDSPTISIAKPIVIKPEHKTKLQNTNNFSINLFKTMVAESKNENLFISPYSASTVLDMLWNGADGNTAKELEKVLGNSTYTKDQINDFSMNLINDLLKVDPTSTLKIANIIVADNSTPFLPSFVEINKKWYNANVRNINFSNSSDVQSIDNWCKKNTNGKISKISDSFSLDTKFALINAIYFKGKWAHKFEKSKTQLEQFTNSDGSSVKVNMMNQREDLEYSDDNTDWKMLKLNYGNKAFSMVILMPLNNEPLDSKISTLTSEKFYALLNSMNEYLVTVKLPKFRSEYKHNLNEVVLPKMGITELFDSQKANLSQMCESNMVVDKFIQKTYIDVYEEGTEAAAATIASGDITSPPPGTPIDFFVDKPFIYSIIEESTGTILFIGRMNCFN